jgi:uncharacterized protein (TIGR02145 family)/uncharacterized repeat protein (TIGR02543 family)
MKLSAGFLSVIVPLLLFCGYGDNKYDPDNPDYVEPAFTVDADLSTIVESDDTTTADTVVISLKGNDRDHRNQFRFSIDDSGWSEWSGDKSAMYAIRLTGLASGAHSITIQTCYHPKNDDYNESTITFFQAREPEIVDMANMLFDADAEESCTLWVKAEGTGELTYAWYCDTTHIDTVTDDSLIIEDVSIDDTAVIWFCRVSSKWGETTSNDIRLRVLFHVTYDGNNHSGGETAEDTNSYETGDIATVPGNTGGLLRGGYTFNGWNTKKDGTGTTRDSGDIFKIEAENITLYAKWNPNPSFTLAYDRNGATGGTVPDTARLYKTGEPVTIPGNSDNLVKTGYTFTGWNTKPDGSGDDYDTGTTIAMVAEYLKLFAQWEIIQYTVKFDSWGGTAVAEQKVDYGKLLSEPADPVWAGYTFLGWYKDSTYTASWVFANKVTGDMTLYAKWIVRDADGNIYTTVTIGNQIWLVENLKTTKYNDTTTIPPVTDSAAWAGLSSGGYCWYNNESANKSTYGALYNWYAVKTGRLAPKGWHVATDAEWDTLISKLGDATDAGGKLKEAGTDHWSSPNTGATNESGFFALPGGYRRGGGTVIGIEIKIIGSDFSGNGTLGSWWSSTESAASSAWYRSVSNTNTTVNRADTDKRQGRSVRCVRDALFIRPIIPVIPEIKLSPTPEP